MAYQRSTRELEKVMAKTFYKFLDDNALKGNMEKSQLEAIYNHRFKPTQEMRISFGKIFNALSFHLDICQEVKGKVIFGSGEEAALHLLSNDDDQAERKEILSEKPFLCRLCMKNFRNDMALFLHQQTVKHRQQEVLKKIKESLTSPELIKNKMGVEVTSVPPQDENGVIEHQIQIGETGKILLNVRNSSERKVSLKLCTLLWSSSFFDYRDIARIDDDRGTFNPGESKIFTLGCRKRREFGHSYVPAVLTFHCADGIEFHIMRFISVRIVSDLYNELKVQSKFQKPRPAFRVPSNITTTPGLPLPKLKTNGLVLEKLDQYEIPVALKAQVLHDNQISDGLRKKLERDVSFESYKEQFSALLHIEETQMQRDIRNYDLKDVTFEKDARNPKLLVLRVPGLAENRPSVLRGDRLFAYESGVMTTRYEGIVHVVELEDVKIGFDLNRMPYIRNQTYDVQFTFNRLPIKMQHRACIQATSKRDLQHVLFPDQDTASSSDEIYGGQPSPFYDRNLNPEQQKAVKNILVGKSRPAPYLIFGPPGTGKTVTVVEAIKQVHHVLPNSFILACAPENSAADLLVERLLPHIEKRNLFRMYATSRSWNFVPEKLKDARVVNFDPVTKEIFYPTKEELMKYRIVVTTLVTGGRLVSATFPRDHFTHIFVDEAGHAVEPECIIPVAGLLDPNNDGGGQLVLAGDPKQLGPIIRSRIAQQYGLETSLLERLMTSSSVYGRGALGYSDNLLTKLVNNYRSHRQIIEIPKKLFYDDELNECAGEFRQIMLQWEELPNPQFPLIFHPVFGADEREGQSPSFFSVAEVETIERYLKKLLDNKERSKRLRFLKPENIGIISPYRRQVQKIQKMVEKRKFGNIKVGSVEEFQGQERLIIIISTVRSTKKEYLQLDEDFRLGFLNNPKRFNVAVTRAQALLIVIGNPEMLTKDDNWRKFIEFCEENNGCVEVTSRTTLETIYDLLKRLKLTTNSEDEPEEQSEISQREQQENPEWTRHE